MNTSMKDDTFFRQVQVWELMQGNHKSKSIKWRTIKDTCSLSLANEQMK